MTEKVVLASKNDFDQRTACGAPARWSKYTTNKKLVCFFSIGEVKVPRIEEKYNGEAGS